MINMISTWFIGKEENKDRLKKYKNGYSKKWIEEKREGDGMIISSDRLLHCKLQQIKLCK